MVTKRKYHDRCAMAHALDVVGERWALLVVRELLFGPKRFTDLRAGLPGASPNVLSLRLRELEESGVLCRRKLAPPSSARVYELTPWGYGLEPMVIALGRWGARSPGLPRDGDLGPDSVMLAVKTLYRPDIAAGFTADLAVRLGDDRFHVRFADGLHVRRAEPEAPDAVLATTPRTLAELLWNDGVLTDAEAAAEVSVTGDRTRVERFLRLFPLPEPV
ncbi:winged helix-turn-helix transcriptional regulator [Actinosynnema sp. NPDC047251]|uniref:Transcriptional regulator n=1 Tax=Saccharothrix espanaensis (strain ATCC 51144 / DSM 44229 / JCM 9112 / NBRC 15066 / NRRL 15764) TaxID=1179773 RepID=K0JSD7_SACES|nr:winged helix-turn-helix transcriptional regulator [Saccharothrix espanaensis]CCH30580.1 Transcriptional regulator [Saccharothrix espanaensis DSM 44229]